MLVILNRLFGAGRHRPLIDSLLHPLDYAGEIERIVDEKRQGLMMTGSQVVALEEFVIVWTKENLAFLEMAFLWVQLASAHGAMTEPALGQVSWGMGELVLLLHWYWGRLMEKSCVLLLLLLPVLMRRPDAAQCRSAPEPAFEHAAAPSVRRLMNSSCADWSRGDCMCDFGPDGDDCHGHH